MGKVYLVGAGPGDPELITVKGLRVLREANVILYDRLAPQELLDECKADAEKIYVGKVPKKVMGHQQDEINRLLVSHAQQGKTVVRLKGGDPFVFGRGGEEALACAKAGVAFEVVPGISSSIAVPAYAGVPVTQRDYNNTFAVFSGHNDPDVEPEAVNYQALAKIGAEGTVVILMGIMFLDGIMRELLKAGLPPETPAITIQQGTTANQRAVEANAQDLAQAVKDGNIKAPATTLIGSVAELRHQGIEWFVERAASAE
ncbi:MAG: uroporphyrinogen-III C-methyltransferase [Chloroflexota bacterium]